jgi:hypothetical protein
VGRCAPHTCTGAARPPHLRSVQVSAGPVGVLGSIEGWAAYGDAFLAQTKTQAVPPCIRCSLNGDRASRLSSSATL